ncbi:MAG: aldose 1-epimerase [Acidimicrobiales bacterium]|nr:aldose 1-epimerase [Acidimicrobiales bacterium]
MTNGPGVAVRTWLGSPAVDLSAGDLTATFLPNNGMLGVSMRLGREEWLALPARRSVARRRGAMAGIPLLAPWANRIDGRHYRIAGVDVDLTGQDVPTDPNGLPIHGLLLGRSGWAIEVLEAGAGAARLRARFDAAHDPEVLAAFPFPHRITVEASVDPAALTIATTLLATGDRPVPVAFGWHPYLSVPDAPRAAWELHLPEREELLLDDRLVPTGQRAARPAEHDPIGVRVFDDLYALGSIRTFALRAGARRLDVTFDEGYPFAQVYAPEAGTYACIEPMTAPGNALVSGDCRLLPPGEEHRAVFTLAPSAG